MTYFLAWDLSVDPGQHHPAGIDAALEEAVAEDGNELMVHLSYDGYEAEPVSGYDPTEDLEADSLRFPRALFTLTATDCENYLPPEQNGYRRVYVQAGRHHRSQATVVFEPFDPGRLSPT